MFFVNYPPAEADGFLTEVFMTITLSVASDHTTLYAIAPEDGAPGFIIGDLDEVAALRDKLNRLLETRQADEETTHLDERIGVKWLSVSQAEKDFGVSGRSIRWAIKSGLIRAAELQDGKWRFPQHTFLAWMNSRPGSGRPRKDKAES